MISNFLKDFYENIIDCTRRKSADCLKISQYYEELSSEKLNKEFMNHLYSANDISSCFILCVQTQCVGYYSQHLVFVN